MQSWTARAMAAFGIVAMVAAEDITVAKGSDPAGLIPKTPKEILSSFYKSEGSSVINLEESTFKMAIDAYAHTIVYFYTPNCKLCANLGPAFEKAASVMKNRRLDPSHEVGFAQVDINSKRVIAEHFNIGYVPHLRVFTQGNVTGERYNSYLGSYNQGVRTVFSIVNHAMRISGLPLNIAENEIDFLNMRKLWLKHDNDALMLAFYDSEKGNKEQFAEYADSAFLERNMTYHVCTNKTIMEKFKVTPPAIVMLKNFDEKRNDLPAEDLNNKDKIEEFKKKNSIPRLIDYNPNGKAYWKTKIWNGHYGKFMVLMGNASSDGFAETRATMSDACNTFGTYYDRGDITCLVVDTTASDLVNGLSGYYNVKVADLPQVMVLEQDRPSFSVGKTYKMGGDFSKDAVVDFYKDYQAGDAEQYYRSETPAEKQEATEVIKLVGTDFQEQMKGFKDKNVLLKVVDSHLESVCWKGGEACPANFSAVDLAFAGLVDKFSALKGSLAFAEVDVRLNDFKHYAPDYPILDYDTAKPVVANEGPIYYLFGADKTKAPKKFEDDIEEVDEVSGFLKEAGISATDEDVMDEL